MFASETFVDLLKSGPHWAFELTLMAVFDGVIGLLAWPAIKRAVRRHDAKKHPNCGVDAESDL